MAGTKTLLLHGSLAPIDCSEIQALFNIQKLRKEDNKKKVGAKVVVTNLSGKQLEATTFS
jgi:hypothetical protein